MKRFLKTFLFFVIIYQLFIFGVQGAWTVDMFNSTHDVQTDMQALEDNINLLKQNFSSTSEPANLSAGQWWADTTTGILKLRNATNTAWQYVWDMTNNLPMGSVVSVGTITYPGTQLLDVVALSTGTTNTRVATTEFNFVISGGAPVNKAAVAAGTAFSSSFTIQNNTWGSYVVAVDGSGTITFTAAAGNYTSTYVTEEAAITALPATPGGTCRLGYFTVHAPVAGFTENTTPLTSYATYYVDSPTNTYTGTITPTPSAYSGIYYVKATYKNYISTPTINLNSLGAKTIKGPDADTLGNVGGTIVAGHRMILYYDGTDMILLNPIGTEHGMNAYTSSGTWIRPKGVVKVFVRVIGGAGGGGGGSGGEPGGAGGTGGYGGYAEGWITVASNIPVVIGAGGTGGAGGDLSASNGNTGGTSSFNGTSGTSGYYIYAAGGTGGVGATSAGPGGNGTTGTGTGGTINSLLYDLATYGKGGAGGSGQGVAGATGGAGLITIIW
jgi:hypothetical protein